MLISVGIYVDHFIEDSVLNVALHTANFRSNLIFLERPICDEEGGREREESGERLAKSARPSSVSHNITEQNAEFVKLAFLWGVASATFLPSFLLLAATWKREREREREREKGQGR